MLLTYEQLKEHLSKVTYYEGWEMSLYVGNTEGIFMLIKATLDDNFNPGKKFSFEVYTPVPPQVSIESFSHWINWRLYRTAIHESMERFKVNGEVVFDPHAPNFDRNLF